MSRIIVDSHFDVFGKPDVVKQKKNRGDEATYSPACPYARTDTCIDTIGAA